MMNDAGERAFVLAYKAHTVRTYEQKNAPWKKRSALSRSELSARSFFRSFFLSSPRRWEKMALEIVEEEEEEEAGVASGEGVMMEAGEVDIS